MGTRQATAKGFFAGDAPCASPCCRRDRAERGSFLDSRRTNILLTTTKGFFRAIAAATPNLGEY